MKKKLVTIFILGFILTIFMLFINRYNFLKESWVGSYRYEEFAPPNIGMNYVISIYEDGSGLYAKIKIDGFQTLKRLKAKVWSHKDEILFEFIDHYTDEKGNTTEIGRCKKGSVLLKIKKQNNILITEWGELTPILDVNKEAGLHFERISDES